MWSQTHGMAQRGGARHQLHGQFFPLVASGGAKYGVAGIRGRSPALRSLPLTGVVLVNSDRSCLLQ